LERDKCNTEKYFGQVIVFAELQRIPH